MGALVGQHKGLVYIASTLVGTPHPCLVKERYTLPHVAHVAYMCVVFNHLILAYVYRYVKGSDVNSASVEYFVGRNIQEALKTAHAKGHTQ